MCLTYSGIKKGIPTEQTWQEFKALYDGYRFEWDGEYIYNPFSVLSAFDSGKLRNYWYKCVRGTMPEGSVPIREQYS